jgi:hypothetical protein
VVAETASGKTTHVDAVRILARMRGCGFTPGPDEHRKVLNVGCRVQD